MTLTDLHREAESAYRKIHLIHWSCRGSNFWLIHKDVTDPIYKYLQEVIDELGELCIQHEEEPFDLRQATEFAITQNNLREVGNALDVFLSTLQVCSEEYSDIGLQNYFGQVYQDLSKWRDYFILNLCIEEEN